MASIPPSELPPEPSTSPAETPPPSQPGEPSVPPVETPSPTPDIDVPSPGEPTPGTASPIAAGSSLVGARQPGDSDDIGSTTAMTAETGGLAGTSR